MTLKSKSRESNGVTILDLSGRMTLGEDTVLRVYNGQELGWRAEAAESHKKSPLCIADHKAVYGL